VHNRALTKQNTNYQNFRKMKRGGSKKQGRKFLFEAVDEEEGGKAPEVEEDAMDIDSSGEELENEVRKKEKKRLA
jgi:hypothetical protein